MAKYKKRKDGRYYTQVNTGKYTDEGKPIRIPVYAYSCSALDKKVSEIKTDLQRGTYADDHGNTFGQYAEKWVDTYKKCKDIATYKKYKGIIRNHISDIADIRLKDLTKSDIQGQLAKLSDHPDTKRMLLITVKQILETAIDDGLLYRNVARSIKNSMPAKEQETRSLTDAEKKAIKYCSDNLFDNWQILFVNTLFVSGIRPQEALALTRNDVDIFNSTININKALSWKGGKHIKAPKTQKGYRTIPVPANYIELFKKCTSGSQSLYLFPGKNNELISQSTYKRIWADIYEKIDRKMGGTEHIHATDLHPYIFRHNYATMLYYNGVDIKEAQRLLGHSSIRITLEIYTHLESEKSTLRDKINSIAL